MATYIARMVHDPCAAVKYLLSIHEPVHTDNRKSLAPVPTYPKGADLRDASFRFIGKSDDVSYSLVS